MQTITLPFHSEAMRTTAAQILAALVREGVGFRATTSPDEVELIITFTGGF